MKLKELHALMQEIKPFERPKVELEQYPTGPHLASRLLFTVANSYDEFEGQTVIDLGCGTGMLAIGAAMLGAVAVVGVDLDGDALATARSNIEQFEGLESAIDLVQADVRALAGAAGAADRRRTGGGSGGSSSGREGAAKTSGEGAGEGSSSSSSGGGGGGLGPACSPLGCICPLPFAERADVVVMNPPFGTRSKGADADFVRAAFRLSRGAVYSLHKSSTRDYLQRLATRELGSPRAEVLAELRYDLPPTYAFHKSKSKDIEVDLWRFEVPPLP